jgi:glutaredoxin 3
MITIYTKTGCPYCAAAKKFYTDSKTAFEEINLTELPQFKAKVLEMTGGQKIVPVIVGDGDLKLGFGGG